MPPIKDSLACYPENQTQLQPEPYTPDASYDSEAQVCWAQDSFATTEANSPDQVLRQRAAALKQGILTRPNTAKLGLASRISKGSFGDADPTPKGSNSLLLSAASVLQSTSPINLMACNHEPLNDSPPDDVDPPPDENPDPTDTSADGISGVNMSFASSRCGHPVDMDADTANNRIFTTCADDPRLDSSSDGVGVVEILNTDGTTAAINLPTEDPTSGRPIALTTSHLADNGLLYVGFRAAGSTSTLEAGDEDALKEDSGIFIVDPDSPGSVQTVRFTDLLANLGMPMSNFRNPDSDQPVIARFRPNTPIAINHVGNELYVLTANTVFNPLASSNPLDVVRPTILAYTIGSDGSLTPREVTSQANRLVDIDGSNSNAYELGNSFFPAGMMALDDGRLVVLSRGVPTEDITTDSPSSISVVASGLGVGRDDWSFTSSASEPSFLSFSPGQLSYRKIDGVPYAQVGSSDTSGRVAHVNLDTGEVSYLTPFKIEGENISNLIFHKDSNVPASLVVAENGEIRTLFYDKNEISPTHSIASQVTGSTDVTDVGIRRRIPMVLLGGKLYVAAGGSYSTADLQTPNRN